MRWPSEVLAMRAWSCADGKLQRGGYFRAGNEKRRGKSAALGIDRNEHLFSRCGEWRRGKFVAGGFGAEIGRLV